MSTPVPAPRSAPLETKKPVPTPRKTIPVIKETTMEVHKSPSPKENESNFNTFTKRVRTLSNTSKQIREELAGKVQEAVTEGRQSMRKLRRRFTTAGCDSKVFKTEKEEEDTRSEPAVDIFNSISFQSPIVSKHSSIYSNVSPEFENISNSSEESSLPPPNHPPPPLREDSFYDQPHSLASGSSNSNNSSNSIPCNYENAPLIERNCNYESVYPPYAYNSDSESCVDMSVGTVDKKVDLLRSESWTFYDPVAKNENVYSNEDSTPVLNTQEAITSSVDETASMVSHLSVQNSLYENSPVTPPPRPKRDNRRATESVIMQFDPLTAAGPSNQETYKDVNDLRALEELLQGDLYGTVSSPGTYDNWSTSNESDVEDYINPPTPPERFDSLPEDTSPTTPAGGKTQWFTGDSAKEKNSSVPSTPTPTENKKFNWFKQQVNDVLKKQTKHKDYTVARPVLSPKGIVQQKGMLYKVTNGPVEDLFGEFSARWCILENANFICYFDNSVDNVKEHFTMESIISIQILLDQKYRYDNNDLHCFELCVSGKSRGGHIYGSRSISERRLWMQRLAESLTNRFNAKITSDYSRIGWAYVREGVTGQWVGAWLVLSKRSLHYAIDKSSEKNIDLRKARCIILQTYQEGESYPRTNDKGPNLLVDCPNGVLYLRMWTARHIKAWCHNIRLAAHNNGALLDQQQLTKHDVPVIVEKCINFIYAHGSMTEGIYRKAGSGASVNEILTQFRRDAFAVQLTNDKYSEHDVATALKRFFRELPEPLLITKNRQYLYQVTLVQSADEKIRMFRAIFDHYSPVSYKTTRKLLSHLHFISTQKKKNLMTVDNLAAVWGPTLMCCEENDDSQYGQKETSVVSNLITLYRSIFPENPEEIEQERLMLQVLERCARSPLGPVNTKTSGDLRVWVHLFTKEGQTHHIAIGPQKTAYDVCQELSSKMKLGVHELQLEEYVLNGNLTRPVHHTEKVLDVVLRWGYWDEADRKDNCLILSPIAKYWEYIQDKPMPVSGELKYADSKSKNFKSYTFEFCQARLSYYKERSCSAKLGSWNIEDILWYVGHEPKRNPQSKWTVTILPKKEPPKRTKSSPWFGNILAWHDPAFRANWLAAMWRAEHPKDLTPPPQHVNLMSN